MCSTYAHKYMRRGYTVYEAIPLMLLEYRGVNKTEGCDIPYAYSVIIQSDWEFDGIHADYDAAYGLSGDKNGRIVIPPPGEDPNYDESARKIIVGKINIHLTPGPDGGFWESKSAGCCA